MRPSKETTNGVKDMVLCYNSFGGWDEETSNYKGAWTPERYRR